MLCGVCREREGETLPTRDGKVRCQCYICTSVRCVPCQEVWGSYSGPIAPHGVPRRREAILATRRKRDFGDVAQLARAPAS